jgi:protocatechuate 3,4-dioxygenase beta subunit
LVADQRIAGIVVDENEKPVAGASINSYGQYGRSKQPNVNGRTDAKGRFSFDQLCEGPISLSVNGPDNSYASVTVEGGDTNITIQLQPRSSNVRYVSGRGSSKLTGVVTDPDGKPAANVILDIFPVNSSQSKKTDAQGRFTYTYDATAYSGISGLVPVIVARDLERNLAAAQDLEEGTTNVSLRLEPGLTLTGAVTGEDGKVITNAEVQLIIRIPRISGSLGSAVRADATGHFEIKAVPTDREFSLSVSAKGYGREQRNVAETDPDTRRVALDTFQLPLANLRVAGVVVDDNDKPVSGASVSLYGPKQPSAATQTDSKGRFAFSGVCAGPVQFSFSNPRGDYGSAVAQGGDTNVTLRASRRSSSGSEEIRPVSLKGKPLPDVTPLGLTAAESPADHPVLVLLIDAEQRPSRRTLKLLSDQADALKQKGIAVIVLQAGTMAADAFADWKKETAPPFPVGAFQANPEKARAAWGAAALPWLILTDKSHRVTAEGFDSEELDAKLQALSKP